MNSTIKFYHKNVYGNDYMYIADPLQARAVEMISGKKVMTGPVWIGLEALGYEFVEITEKQAMEMKNGRSTYEDKKGN